jgi:serine/threonine protein kinase
MVVPVLQRGMAFGPFELVAPIRQGGMGEVWQAVRVGEGGWRKEVALKVMRPTLADEATFVAQFRHEAQLSALLAHPNIVGVSNFGQEGGVFWLELEHVQGEDLYQLLERTPGGLPLPIALFITVEILKGLEHAFTKPGPDGRPLGMIHRDLKPSNVLCAREGHVKLADFGLAKILYDGQATILGFRGTIGYRAPEQFHGHDASPASDVFSVGLILWELLTGGSLFAAATEGERMRLIEQCVVPPLPALGPAIPEGLDVVLRRLLARTPEQRYVDAGEALAALLALPVARPATSYDLKRFFAQLGSMRAGQERPQAPSVAVPLTSGQAPVAPSQGRPAPSSFEYTLLRSPEMFKGRAASSSTPRSTPPPAPEPPPKLAPQLVLPPAPLSPPRSPSTLGSSPASTVSAPSPRPQPPLVGAPPPMVRVPPPPVGSPSPSMAPRASVPPPLVGVPSSVRPSEVSAGPEASGPLPPVMGPPPLVSQPAAVSSPPFAPSPHAPLLQAPPPALRRPSSAPPAEAASPLASPAPAPFASSPASGHAPLLAPPLMNGGGASAVPAASSPPRRANRPAGPAPNRTQGPAIVDGLPPPAEREPLHKRPAVILAAAALALVAIVAVVIALASRSDGKKSPPPEAAGGWPAPAAVAPAAPEPSTAVPATPAPASGAPGLAIVQVVTDPPDARLVVNGTAVPGPSPYVIRDVDARWPVRIRVEAPGFETFDQEIAVTAAKSSIPIKLVPRSTRPNGGR